LFLFCSSFYPSHNLVRLRLCIGEEGIVGRLYKGEALGEEVVVEEISEEEYASMVTLIDQSEREAGAYL
jgi:hypothetical protein